MAAAATMTRDVRNGQDMKFDKSDVFVERRSSSRRPSNAQAATKEGAASPKSERNELPRSASYTYMPHAKAGHFPSDSVMTTFSESDVKIYVDDAGNHSTPESSGWTTPEEHIPDADTGTDSARDLVAQLHKSSKVTPHAISDSQSRSSEDSSLSAVRPSLESSRSKSTAATTPSTHTPRVSVTSNFSRKLARRSWTGSNTSTPAQSRSPSPSKREATTQPPDTERPENAHIQRPKENRRKSLIRRKTAPKPEDLETKEKATPQSSDSERPTPRKSTLLRKRSSRPVSGLFKSTTLGDDEKAAKEKRRQSGVPPMPRPYMLQSFSTDKLPGHSSAPLSPNLQPPSPRPPTSHKPAGLTLPRKKDELWNIFRTLDGDFSKFSSKSLTFKANVVRSSLLPFLRAYANHPSNRTLRVEDLDRRANILNKWWTGLIEMLHGRNNQSISGTDRPAILDAIAGIMERPEWRLSPSPFCPLNARMKGTSSPRNHSTASLSSEQSDFLAESVHHNVRNIFIQNLSSQMAFVVDKMSLRNASASLVTFCGKACAYAFMFVPGMADILGRLWDLQIDTLRRVLNEVGIGKFDDLTSSCELITPNFPPALQQLGFAGLTKYMRNLRTPPPLPLGFSNIHWWGHWLNRWTGRESDLFYVFVKYFYILVTDFLPTESSKEERMCVPGMLLVQAQLLTNLDATIHRDANQAQHDSAASSASPTFDDVFADPDAYTPALPPQPTNAVRPMAENRTVMLIRDFLAERAAQHPVARRLFAEAINNCLQTATRGTSMFDHSACYTLLDFLEEALVLILRFEHVNSGGHDLVDAEFWKAVCTRMVESQNTVTKIRLFAFVYTVWNSFVCDVERKKDMCLGFILEPELFHSMFNHWCPMVRAYFMRLLCWRVGRFDGEPSEGDIEILEVLLQRLQTTWSHYLFLREQTERKGILPPSTNPCNPAPSRRLLIIRTDPQINHDALLSFDGIMAPESQAPAALSKHSKAASSSSDADVRHDSSRENSDSENESRGRGIGGFLKKMLSSKSRSRSRDPSSRAPSALSNASAPPPLPNGLDRSETTKPNGGLVRSATNDSQVPSSTSAGASQRPQPTPQQVHRNFSFKFSLEHQPNAKAMPSIRLTPPRLPLAAQHYVNAHSGRLVPPHQIRPTQPTGASRDHATYCGRALAEWQIMLGECQSFFDRRRGEGVPENKFVETPTLGVEVFRRPG